MENDRIKALISLLDDPDEQVVTMVSRNLMDEGTDIIPRLEEAWEGSFNQLFQSRCENIINDIQFDTLKREMVKWCRHERGNLLKGIYLIARFQFPELKYQVLENEIEVIVKDVWLEINNNLTALEKVRIMNKMIFEIHGFSANSAHIFSPYNNYINHVLDTKKGNALTLAALYMTVAERLHIPIQGVNLPNNFIMAYMDEYVYGDLFRDNILFYIDPLSGGTVLGRREIDHFLGRMKIQPQESFYVPCDHIKLMQRLLSTLVISYDKENQKDKIERIKELFSIITTETTAD